MISLLLLLIFVFFLTITINVIESATPSNNFHDKILPLHSLEIFDSSFNINKISPPSSYQSSKKKRRLPTPSILSAPILLQGSQSHNMLICVNEPRMIELWRISKSIPEKIWSTSSLFVDDQIEEEKELSPSFLVKSSIRATPVVVNEHSVILSFQDGSILSLDPSTPKINWRTAEGAKSWGFDPLVINVIKTNNDDNEKQKEIASYIFAGYRDDDITIYKDSKRNNNIVGKIPKSDGVWSAPSFDLTTKRLYFSATASAKIVCIDISSLFRTDFEKNTNNNNGENLFPKLWEYNLVPNAKSYKEQIPHWIWTSPTIFRYYDSLSSKNHFIAFGSVDGNLRIVNEEGTLSLSSQNIARRFKDQNGVSLSPFVLNEDIVVSVSDGGDVTSLKISQQGTTIEKKKEVIRDAFVLKDDDSVVFAKSTNTKKKNEIISVTKKGNIHLHEFDEKNNEMMKLISKRSISTMTGNIVLVSSVNFYGDLGLLLIATREKSSAGGTLLKVHVLRIGDGGVVDDQQPHTREEQSVVKKEDEEKKNQKSNTENNVNKGANDNFLSTSSVLNLMISCVAFIMFMIAVVCLCKKRNIVKK